MLSDGRRYYCVTLEAAIWLGEIHIGNKPHPAWTTIWNELAKGCNLFIGERTDGAHTSLWRLNGDLILTGISDKIKGRDMFVPATNAELAKAKVKGII